MKKLYKKYIDFIDRLPGVHHYYKMYFAEHNALRRKKKLINKVVWDKSQQTEFDQFWESNYKKIKNSGNKLFEAFNGKFNIRYIPDFLYATEIEARLNLFQYANIYSDKGLTEILYKNKSQAQIPTTFLFKTGGLFYNQERQVIHRDQAKEILLSINEAVIKPTIGGNSGKGVIVGNFDSNGFDEKNNFSILTLLEDNQDNFIVQEKIRQSDELNQIYSKSINTLRVITYIADSSIKLAPVSFRVGSGGNAVDNIHAGGLVVGVDMEAEKLLKYGYKLGYSNSDLKFEKHPDTGIVFEDFNIPGIKGVTESAIILHGFTPHMGIISWDFTLNTERKPVLIEANYKGQSVWFPQIVNAEPIFKEDTVAILKKLKS